jgi:hypothetical protein
MIIPSERYLVSKGFYTETLVNGESLRLMNYERAFQEDPYVRQVIASIAGIFQDRGFPLRDLEASLRSLREEQALQEFSDRPTQTSIRDEILSRARADIVLDLDFDESRTMGESSITFTLRGIDSFTSQEVATVTGTGLPATGLPLPVLLREAVLQRMPALEERLYAHFEDVMDNGRTVRVIIRVDQAAGFDLEEWFSWSGIPGGEDELGEIVALMVRRAALNGQVQVGTRSSVARRFETVRIPVYDDEGLPMDADVWANRELVRQLRSDVGVTARRETRGMGEVTLIITGTVR